METRRVYHFDGVTLDLEAMRLWRDGREVALEPKSFYLLEFLILNRERVVSKEEIFRVIWKDVVVSDNALTRAITQIRKALKDDPRKTRFIETVPKVGYRFTGSLETAQPERVEHVHSAEAPDRRGLTGKTVRIASLVGCICIAVAAAGRWLAHSMRTPAIQSMAVFPLENLSGDAKQDYFAAGTTDELITELARVPNLRVADFNSVRVDKEAHKPLREVAEELHVDAIVEGSVVRLGDQVRINARLVDARNDRHLWADSFEGRADNILALEDEVAREIASHARLALAPQSGTSNKVRKIDPAAHDAYLHGLYLWFSGNNNEEAGAYFRKAIELQPDYALAWSGLANYYGAGTIGGLNDPRVSVPQLKSAALKAVQLDDSLPEAHLALGAAYMCEWDLQAAQNEMDRAIRLDPSIADAYHLRARLDVAENRISEAIQDQRTAMNLDPFERPWGMILILKFARRYDAAIQEAQQRLEAFPNNDGIYWERGQVYERKGEEDKAVQDWEKMELLEGHSGNAAALRNAYQHGKAGLLKALIADDEKQPAGSYVSPVELAHSYGLLGDGEKALSLLEEGYRQRSPQLLWIQTDPAFDFLHEDARYQSLVREIGLPSSS
jgi:TolB-like protein/DNA-binding winged helix-turn-helix (wHTH) protein